MYKINYNSNYYEELYKDYEEFSQILKFGVKNSILPFIDEVLKNVKYKMVFISTNNSNTIYKLDEILIPIIIKDFFKLVSKLESQNEKDSLINDLAKLFIKLKKTQVMCLILIYLQFFESVKYTIKHDMSYENLKIEFNLDEDINLDCNIKYIHGNHDNPYKIKLKFFNIETKKLEYLLSVLSKVKFLNGENNPYHNYKLNLDGDTVTIYQNISQLVLRKIDIINSDHPNSSKKCLISLENEINKRIKFTKRNTTNFITSFNKITKILHSIKVIENVLPYGSTTQFSFNIKSDLEVAVLTSETDESECLTEIFKLLEENEYKNVEIRNLKRIKLINFHDSEYNVKLELVLNNYLGVINSELIRNYCLYDTRCLILINIIKDWSKTRKINGNFNGYLSSYSYTLMVIYFLQKIYPPVLPIFHTQNFEKFSELSFRQNGVMFNCYLNVDYDKEVLNKNKPNKLSVAELLFYYFYFYLHLFNSMDYCIDISISNNVYRFNEVTYLKSSVGKKLPVYCFIDPIDYSYNPGSYLIKNSTQEDKFFENIKLSIDNIMIGKSIFSD